MKLLAALAVAVAGVGGAMVVATQPGRPTTADRVTQFGVDHPQWRIFVERRVDTTPLRFEHAVHMNPQTPQMQMRLKAWADAGQKGIVADDAGTLTMSCAACHEQDDAGRYMKPIAFAHHCAACHGLGQRGGEDVPHGSDAATFAERIAAKTVLSPKPAKPATPTGAPPRGPAGPRGPQATAAPKPATPTLTEEQAQQQFAKAFDDEKAKMLRSVGQSCTKCHGKTGLDPATVAPPHIPDRWLPRSVFGHEAHAFIACVDCHADAAAVNLPPHPDADWTGRTRDVMLPDMQSCTACHSAHPTGSSDPVHFDCVLCHVYHPRP